MDVGIVRMRALTILLRLQMRGLIVSFACLYVTENGVSTDNI